MRLINVRCANIIQRYYVGTEIHTEEEHSENLAFYTNAPASRRSRSWSS